MLLGSVLRAKTSFLTSKKSCTTCPKWGGCNLGNDRKKTLFLMWGVPFAKGRPLDPPSFYGNTFFWKHVLHIIDMSANSIPLWKVFSQNVADCKMDNTFQSCIVRNKKPAKLDNRVLSCFSSWWVISTQDQLDWNHW